jgi:hypothetical protein
VRDRRDDVDLTKDRAGEVNRAGFTVKANQQDPAAATSTSEGCRRSMRRTARLDYNIEAFTVTDFEQELGEIVVGRVDNMIRSKSRGGCEPVIVYVDGHNTSALDSTGGASDKKRPNAAHADYGHALLRLQRYTRQSVQCDR